MNRKITIGLLGLSIVATPVWMAALACPTDQAITLQEKSPAFHGKVEAVSASANTLTVDGKVINITASSKLTKADKAITLAPRLHAGTANAIGLVQSCQQLWQIRRVILQICVQGHDGLAAS